MGGFLIGVSIYSLLYHNFNHFATPKNLLDIRKTWAEYPKVSRSPSSLSERSSACIPSPTGSLRLFLLDIVLLLQDLFGIMLVKGGVSGENSNL